MTARDEILARIEAALHDRPPVPAAERTFRTATDPSVDLVALFAERIADYRATVHLTSPEEAAETVASALAAREARRIAVPADLEPRWLGAARVEAVLDEPPLSHARLDELDGVITECAIAIAETGTIVLDGLSGQGRRALSLLPDYHLCLVRADRIVGSVPEAIARLHPARPLTWISGPSATSDIELQRVEGVHGPRTLEVVVVAAARSPTTSGTWPTAGGR